MTRFDTQNIPNLITNIYEIISLTLDVTIYITISNLISLISLSQTTLLKKANLLPRKVHL